MLENFNEIKPCSAEISTNCDLSKLPRLPKVLRNYNEIRKKTWNFFQRLFFWSYKSMLTSITSNMFRKYKKKTRLKSAVTK